MAEFHAKLVSTEIIKIAKVNEPHKIDPSHITYGNLFSKQRYALELGKQNCYLRGCKSNIKHQLMKNMNSCLVISESLNLSSLKALDSLVHHGVNKIIQTMGKMVE